ARCWFQPADVDDLADFMALKPDDIAVLPIGVGSNLLVRDGGVDAVVLRLSGPLAKVEADGERLTVGAGVTDRGLAIQALEAGLSGFEFYVGIPGTLGGGIRMNAGAYGGETADLVEQVIAMDPQGGLHELSSGDLGFSYRHSKLPEGWIAVAAVMKGVAGNRERIRAQMARIKAERDVAQPIRVATGGSTFKNPPGQKAWELIDAAGCRGLMHKKAQVSEKHCNFLINAGGARASDIEELGELVREKVRMTSGVSLEWEIHRVGRANGQSGHGPLEVAA
ncbi:MAG: UDP-N-acetylmuramate dehydrogenase, partial [Alphaproteobacteria bacterium]|nr:UDP-N-acetylmuramate dehydrogenase [Alphaproteobacteria bacterium]